MSDSTKVIFPCPECGGDAPLYIVAGENLVCGDCIDRAVDAAKEAEALAND